MHRTHQFQAMGSECAFHFCGRADKAIQLAQAELSRLENRYSRYRPDSILSLINDAAAHGKSIVIDSETSAIIQYAIACHKKSGGLFDITSGVLRRAWKFAEDKLPDNAELNKLRPLIGMHKVTLESQMLSFAEKGMELDLGGIVKEYAADRAAEIFESEGITHALIDMGGDLRAIGPRDDGSAWEVYIRDPRHTNTPIAVARLTHGGLATSGDYERYILINGERFCHIINPYTLLPVRDLSSVTVWAQTCLLAGSFSTIAMLKESSGPAWLVENGASSLWVNTVGNTGTTGQMPLIELSQL